MNGSLFLDENCPEGPKTEKSQDFLSGLKASSDQSQISKTSSESAVFSFYGLYINSVHTRCIVKTSGFTRVFVKNRGFY